jgi:hypothetical protein
MQSSLHTALISVPGRGREPEFCAYGLRVDVEVRRQTIDGDRRLEARDQKRLLLLGEIPGRDRGNPTHAALAGISRNGTSQTAHRGSDGFFFQGATDGPRKRTCQQRWSRESTLPLIVFAWYLRRCSDCDGLLPADQGAFP